MSEPSFFPEPEPLPLDEIVALTGAKAPVADLSGRFVVGVAPIDNAGPHDLTFLENPSYFEQAGRTKAAACFVAPRFADKLPEGTVALVSPQPYKAFAQVAGRLYPSALRPGGMFGHTGIAPGAQVHPEARLERGVTVDPGAVIGPGAEIGQGSVIAAGAVIGPQVRIGRQVSVGANATIVHALIGDRVILHPGVHIGQDGFGFAMGPGGHLKVPQIGRVIIQDDVEIGAGSCVDRGANRDTVIGEGTKIDNLVQIAHNVVIGRHCVIVSQVGISGSATLEDFVVLGGHVGVVGHLTIGMGAQIAGSSNVNSDVPRGARWGGTPAKPVRDWFREMLWLKKMAARGGAAHGAETKGGE
jgi:UDP-3-O-[3-hydroxymyristoyl] glucosamine N-acyltransferase